LDVVEHELLEGVPAPAVGNAQGNPSGVRLNGTDHDALSLLAAELGAGVRHPFPESAAPACRGGVADAGEQTCRVRALSLLPAPDCGLYCTTINAIGLNRLGYLRYYVPVAKTAKQFFA
jgi:hypothetical protein